MIQTVKNTGKYLKSFVITPEIPRLSYSSYILFFKAPDGKLVVDKAYIFLGNIPDYFANQYLTLINWSVMDGNLIYGGEIYDSVEKKFKTFIEIDSIEVYLHIKVGTIRKLPKDIQPDINLFFSNPDSKLAKSLDLNDKVKIVDMSDVFGRLDLTSIKDRVENTDDPRFYTYKHQIYGKDMDQVMFCGLNLDLL